MRYRLTYLGPSTVFYDPATDTSWSKGESADVDEDTRNRLSPPAPDDTEDTDLRGERTQPRGPHDPRWEVEEIADPPAHRRSRRSGGDDNPDDDTGNDAGDGDSKEAPAEGDEQGVTDV